MYDFLQTEIVTDNDVYDVNVLLAQLTTLAQSMNRQYLAAIASSSHLLIAREEHSKRIKGMATLCIIHKPTGPTGIIEDVVVDDSFRGQHIGETLVLILVKRASELSLKHIHLTSKSERIAANHLYRKIGFKLRETNHYELTI